MVGFHLDYKKNRALLQIKMNIKITEKENPPIMVAGDFNVTLGSENIKLLDKNLYPQHTGKNS